MKINPNKCSRIDACAWCGKLYMVEHANQKYCSKKCADERQRERARAYNAYKRKLYKKFPLGTTNLRKKRHPNFERELELVEKEYGRVFGDRR